MKLIRLFPALLPLALGSCGLYFGPVPPCPPCKPGPGTWSSEASSQENLSEAKEQVAHRIAAPQELLRSRQLPGTAPGDRRGEFESCNE